MSRCMACRRGGAETWWQSSERGVGVGGLGVKGIPGANADAAARDGRESAARELGGGAFLAGETVERGGEERRRKEAVERGCGEAEERGGGERWRREAAERGVWRQREY